MATYEVDVNGTVYEVDAPDERTAWKWANSAHSKQQQKAPEPRQAPGSKELPSFSERMGSMGKAALRGLMMGGPTGLIAEAGKESMSQFGDVMDKAAYTAGGAVTDALAPHVSPEVAGGAGYVANVATQAVPVVAGTMAGRALDPKLKAPFKWAGEKIRNLADPWLPGGVDRAVGRTAVQAAGPKRQAVIEALKQNRQIVPGSMPHAGEAAASAGSAEFSGLQRAVQGKMPSAYAEREAANEAARRASIQGIAGTQDDLSRAITTRNENAREAYGAIRHNRIGPESNAQIMSRAISERTQAKDKAVQELAENFVPVPGQPRVSGRLVPDASRIPAAQQAAKEEEFLSRAMDLMRETVGMENRSLTSLLSRPSMKAAVNDAMKSAQETGSYFPSKAGDKFSIQNLQRMKESLDAGIRAAKASADAGRRPVLSPTELDSTKKAFVEWLSSRSPEWKAARLQYLEDSLPINRMQVGQELQKSLTSALGTTERPAAFASAVQNAPRTIKRATGQTRFDSLDEVLDPQQTQTVTNVLDDLRRSADYETLARAGSEKAADLIGEIAPKAPALGMFNPKYSVARSLAARLAGRVEGKAIDALSEAMLDPQKMARLMEAASPTERAAIVQALIGQRALGGTLGGAAGGLYGYESGRAP